jgi:hypothetical protein
VTALAGHGGLLLGQESADDCVGDRVGVHAIFAATDLLRYLTDAHCAFTFPYRLWVTDQL